MKLLLGAVIGLVLLAAAPAQAKNKDKAREAYRLGIQHYNLSEYSEALAAFKDAYRNYEDPSFLFNIGQCHRSLGQKVEAVQAYRSFLREATNQDQREDVEKLIVSLEEAIKMEQVANSRPPQGTLDPNAPRRREPPPVQEVTPAPVGVETPVVVARPAERRATPIYKKWWLWTAVAVVAVGIGVGVGVGVGAARSPSFPSSMPTDGTFRF